MDLSNVSDRDLVAMIVGKAKARKMYNGSLASLLAYDSAESHPSLFAAYEFVVRALREEMPRHNCLTSPFLVRDYLRTQLRNLEHEVFVVILLNQQNRVIRHELMFRGTHDNVSIHPREIVKTALKHNACGVIFAHNHPSGDPKPSPQDVATTLDLANALGMVEIQVYDHILIAGSSCVSFAERGLLK